MIHLKNVLNKNMEIWSNFFVLSLWHLNNKPMIAFNVIFWTTACWKFYCCLCVWLLPSRTPFLISMCYYAYMLRVQESSFQSHHHVLRMCRYTNRNSSRRVPDEGFYQVPRATKASSYSGANALTRQGKELFKHSFLMIQHCSK